MRILHCSDFHANTPWFAWLAEAAARFDLVCLSGDLLDLTDMQSINAQLDMVQTSLSRITTPLAICSGNNDAFNSPPAPPCLLHAAWIGKLRRPGLWADGDRFETNGLKVRCLGWNERPPPANGDEVWLSHAPPARAPVAMDASDGDVGDEILGERCRAGKGPGELLSGHQHDPQRWMCRVGQTWCFNPGYDGRALQPNHIILDTTELVAELVSGGRTADIFNLGYPA